MTVTEPERETQGNGEGTAERQIGLDNTHRHDLWHKVKRGITLWRSGKVSLGRVANAGLCNLSLRWRLSRVLGKPYSLAIEPTNVCNLRCPLCPTGRETLGRKPGTMSMEVFKQCIDALGPYLIDVNVSLMGEPTLVPHLPEMIAYAKAAGPQVVMASNGHFLSEETSRQLIESGLDKVYISFDATGQEAYEKYRVRGDFAKVVEGTRTLLAQRDKLGRTNPFVEAQFLVMRHNEHQIEDFRKLADEIGVDRRIIKPVSFNVSDWDDPDTRKTFEDFYPEDERHRVYRRLDGELTWKMDHLSLCTSAWRSVTVLCDGSIIPCCRDVRGLYTMGNVAEGVLKVWNGKRFRAFRRNMVERRSQMRICKICPGE